MCPAQLSLGLRSPSPAEDNHQIVGPGAQARATNNVANARLGRCISRVSEGALTDHLRSRTILLESFIFLLMLVPILIARLSDGSSIQYLALRRTGPAYRPSHLGLVAYTAGRYGRMEILPSYQRRVNFWYKIALDPHGSMPGTSDGWRLVYNWNREATKVDYCCSHPRTTATAAVTYSQPMLSLANDKSHLPLASLPCLIFTEVNYA
ncbi:hypothetical protein B0J12DRAFT_690057 [Macrophomina phaseolina]|uniref:Uncharacterized protein n=1 Tax=Macrophomina phaseolina TaxID=35725 RepID=A0ABQ8FQM4_9PEZI|nr:hypothetical protein B0J12DRAFT_690057 [Macrophomina phaseolina]